MNGLNPNLRPVRYAVVGAGSQARENLVPTLANIQLAELVAICDLDYPKAEMLANRFGVRCYSDYEEMLAAEKIDAIVCASTPRVHYAVARACLQHGTSIFVEKPPTSNIEELRTLREISESRDVVTGVGMNFRFSEPIREALKLTKHPAFGEILHVGIKYYSRLRDLKDWSDRGAFWNSLLSDAIHPVDLIQFICGPSRIVSCEVSVNSGTQMISCMGSSDRGGSWLMSFGNVGSGFLFECEIVGSGGAVLKVNSLRSLDVSGLESFDDSGSSRWQRRWSPRPLDSGYQRSGYGGELHQFSRCVASRENFEPSFQSLIPTYECLEDLYEQFSELKAASRW